MTLLAEPRRSSAGRASSQKRSQVVARKSSVATLSSASRKTAVAVVAGGRVGPALLCVLCACGLAVLLTMLYALRLWARLEGEAAAHREDSASTPTSSESSHTAQPESSETRGDASDAAV